MKDLYVYVYFLVLKSLGKEVSSESQDSSL